MLAGPAGFGHGGYMPPEVAKKLKAQGLWREGAGSGGAKHKVH
jgi:hypothetical protein